MNSSNIRQHTDPRVIKLSETLSVSLHEAIGLTKYLCNFTAVRKPFGGLAEYTDEQLEQVLRLSGDYDREGNLVAALYASGHLQKSALGATYCAIDNWNI